MNTLIAGASRCVGAIAAALSRVFCSHATAELVAHAKYGVVERCPKCGAESRHGLD